MTATVALDDVRASSAPPDPALAHTGESWSEGRLTLPGGVLDADGVCHRTVWVRELVGRDEEILAGRHFATGAQQVTELLAQVITRVGTISSPFGVGDADAMLVGDRDYLVLRLRQMTHGDAVHQVMRCPTPSCGQKVDVEFAISEIPVRRLASVQRTYVLRLSRPAIAGDERSTECVLRLPTGDDLAALGDLPSRNAARANTVLYARLIERLGHSTRISEERVHDLSIATRREIGDFLRTTAPGPDLDIAITCPHCGSDMSYPFDLGSFFFSEWRMNADSLYRQVHHLALHYHWSEAEIMAMSRRKRERYLGMLLERMESESR